MSPSEDKERRKRAKQFRAIAIKEYRNALNDHTKEGRDLRLQLVIAYPELNKVFAQLQRGTP